MNHKLKLPTLLQLALVLLFVSGCGKGYSVKGRVLQGGKNLNLAEQEQLEVVFWRLNDNGGLTANYPAGALNDGSFFVPELPEGQYRIAVKILGPTRIDNLRDAYSEAKSPFQCSVPKSDELILDLPRTQRKP